MLIPGSRVRALARALTIALAVAVAGCASGGSTGPDDADPDFGSNDPEVIVALGDSITFGAYDRGVESCDEQYRGAGGFCPRIAARIDKIVINEGICGETSQHGADRIDGVLGRYHPGVILIDYGVNDLINGTDHIVEHLRDMIKAARRNHTVPIVGTLLPATGDYAFVNPAIEATNASIRALCQTERVAYADHWLAFTISPGFKSNPQTLLSEDGLHPNAAGYQLMAGTWLWHLDRLY